MKKRWLLLLLSLLLLVSAVSCGEKEQYADDRNTAKVLGAAIDALGDGVSYTTADGGYLDDYFLMPAYVSEGMIQFASNTNNLNEFGVFHVESGKADALEELLEDYLEDSYENNRDWYASYMQPEEPAKLRDAEVETYGNYVAYAIAAKADRDAFFSAVRSALK